MYLKMSVAGHLKIFLTRTRGAFWSIRPAKILLLAVFGTQIVATLIAVYGLFMTPLGWGWAGFVWGYALVWFLINDRIKLLAYRIFDRTNANSKTGTAVLQKTEDKGSSLSKSKNPSKAVAKPDEKAAVVSNKNEKPKPEVKVEAKAGAAANNKEDSDPRVKAEVKSVDIREPKPGSKPIQNTYDPTDLNPEIAKRAYEIFKKRGSQDGQQVKDWEQAKQDMENDKVKAGSIKEIKVVEHKDLS